MAQEIQQYPTCPWPTPSMRPFRPPEAMATMRPLRITIVLNTILHLRLVEAIPMVSIIMIFKLLLQARWKLSKSWHGIEISKPGGQRTVIGRVFI